METTIFNSSSLFIIIVVTLLIIFFAYKDFSTYRSVSHKDFKSVIVSLGVLGTFIGIVIGLWFFDTANIRDSVPELLKGLKIAFITSIEGMLVSVILSIIQVYQVDIDSSKNEIDLLRDVNHNLTVLIENIEFNNFKLISDKGDYYFKQKKYGQALEAYKKFLVVHPDNLEVIDKIVECLLKENKLDEADKFCKEIRDKQSDNNKIVRDMSKIIFEIEKEAKKENKFNDKESLDNDISTNKIDNLMWSAMDDIKKLSWEEAQKYVNNLSLDNYINWRLPTNHELKSLYKDKVKSKNLNRGSYWAIGSKKYSSVAWSTYIGSSYSLFYSEGWSRKTNKHYTIAVREIK